MPDFTPQTIPSLFFHTCDQFANRPAFYEKTNEAWKSIRYDQAEVQVVHIARSLLQLGVKKGDRIAIFAPNCANWVMIDIAIQSVGAITVPIYATLLCDQASFILQHSEASIVFGAEESKLKELTSSHLNHRILLSEEACQDVMSWKAFLEQPHTLSLKEFYLNMKNITPDDISSIVYTSGTTGDPKGVMLSQKNIASNVLASLQVISIDEHDRSLSFLPLSHMFERTAGCFCILAKGASMSFCPDVHKVAKFLQEVHPTILITVPRVLEKVYQKIWDTVKRKPLIIQKLFTYASKTLQKQHPWYFVFDFLFFRKIRKQLGGKIRFIVSGGAALSNPIYTLFDQAGVCILQGYGLTETSPVACVNPPSKRKLGTVGLPLPGVEITISNEQEVLIKGPNIMKGYYKNEDETKRVILDEGYFATGDIGTIDKDGYLSITDRIKDLIVTSGGKKVAPLPIENELIASSWIDQACLVGEGKKTIGALIVPNFSSLERAFGKSIQTQSESLNFAPSSEIYREIQAVVDQVNENLAQYEKVKTFHILREPFQIEKGEITPTLKLRRKIIYDHYASEIDQLLL